MGDGKTATELLRNLLDERGVEYEAERIDLSNYFTWGENDCYSYTEYPDGTVLRIWDCTPEQAIAATLGNDCPDVNDVLDMVEKWRDLVWKLYAALGYARQFGEFSVVDGAVIEGILIGCSGIIDELPQLKEVQFGQMQSAADMLKQSQRWDESQATADMLEKINGEIARQSLNGARRGCPMCEEERRKESQDGQG